MDRVNRMNRLIEFLKIFTECPVNISLQFFKTAKTNEAMGIHFYFHTVPVEDKKYMRQNPCQQITVQFEITHTKIKQNSTMQEMPKAWI